MFESLVKIKKNLIYLLIFLFFNCIFVSLVNANPVLRGFEITHDQLDFSYGITFNDDGTKMYIVGYKSIGGTNRDVVAEYNLTTPYDLSTQSHSQSVNSSTLTELSFRPRDIRFNTDGSKMFISMFGAAEAVKTFELSTPFDISTASHLHTLNPSNSDGDLGLEFNTTGTKIFLSGNSEIHEYTVSTAFDLSSTVTYVRKLDLDFNASSLAFSDDGTTLFALTKNGDKIVEYSLASGFDLSNATLLDEHGVNSEENHPEGIAFNDDGTKVYITGTDGKSSGSREDEVNEYVLPAPYNLGLPTLSSSSPADNATGVSIDANIVLTFSERMDVESGKIRIYKASDITNPVEIIDVTSTQVTGTGTTTITINPNSDFEYGAEHYVLIDATAFDDGSDASYNGITSRTVLNFTVNNNRLDPTTIKDVLGSIDAQSELAKNYISQSIDTVSNRLRYLRQNRLSNALSSQGLSIDLGNTLLTSLANDNIEKNANSIIPDNWSAWTSGSTYVSEIGDSINSSSQETEGQAVALGFDKKLSDSDFLGFAIQYSQSDTDIGTNGTSIDSENMNLTIYRTRPLDNNNFIETLLGVGLIESDLKRVHNSNVLIGTRDGTQIFGSINYGKTINRADFNITPIGSLDLGYTKLDDYKETGINALYYASQRIESGLASFGFEVSDNIQFNENKLKPFGSLKFITDFSNKSDAKINYVTDTSTIYTYTQEANSDHLISSMIGLTFIAGDYLNINSSYSRVQGNRSERRDTIDFAINFISNRETQYSLSLAGDENAEAKLGISKNIYGFDLGFNANQSITKYSNQDAELMLTYNF
ncbi:autotransporter domain-containing protein [Pelagibacteraceae bacterium]|nr:autotransporter domain-containing protein [Pelagibacteraceae bacterium]